MRKGAPSQIIKRARRAVLVMDELAERLKSFAEDACRMSGYFRRTARYFLSGDLTPVDAYSVECLIRRQHLICTAFRGIFAEAFKEWKDAGAPKKGEEFRLVREVSMMLVGKGSKENGFLTFEAKMTDLKGTWSKDEWVIDRATYNYACSGFNGWEDCLINTLRGLGRDDVIQRHDLDK